MSALEVRGRAETALAAGGVAVGTYTFPGGAQVPAVSVGEPAEGVSVTGLEVLISPSPRQQMLDTFSYAGCIESWPLRLINHGGTDLEAAVAALARAFWPFAEDPVLLPETPQTYEQVTFSVTL